MTSTKRAWEPVINQLYARVFSEPNKKRFEKVTLYLSIIGFVFHLVLIYAKKLGLFVFPFETPLLDNPISAIYTPFTIILIYEIYLLVLNLEMDIIIPNNPLKSKENTIATGSLRRKAQWLNW